mmetsp:Transcript_54737/g.116900  ORF Transcript_54737/g.116900 Transcript_54737/m.116900 type:complete len:129 (-) Transcript_54737:6-392(-)
MLGDACMHACMRQKESRKRASSMNTRAGGGGQRGKKRSEGNTQEASESEDEDEDVYKQHQQREQQQQRDSEAASPFAAVRKNSVDVDVRSLLLKAKLMFVSCCSQLLKTKSQHGARPAGRAELGRRQQ